MAFDLDDEELKATRELNGIGEKIPTPDNQVPIEEQMGHYYDTGVKLNLYEVGMSEEEVINQIKDLIKDRASFIGTSANGNSVYRKDKNALQTILSLYQQEKEKVQEYEKQLDLDYVDKNYVSKEYHDMVVKEQNDIINDLKKALDIVNRDKGIFIESYEQEKEKNKKLQEEKEAFEKSYAEAREDEANVVMNAHKVINNLAKAIKFMGTNEELTEEDIIKMFSPEEIKMNFDDFMKRWESEQHKKAKLKEKVIDMTIEDVFNCCIHGFSNAEQVKEYYFKKARENKL